MAPTQDDIPDHLAESINLGASVEFHTTATASPHMTIQRCSCGRYFTSKADLHKHQADGRLETLEFLVATDFTDTGGD